MHAECEGLSLSMTMSNHCIGVYVCICLRVLTGALPGGGTTIPRMHFYLHTGFSGSPTVSSALPLPSLSESPILCSHSLSLVSRSSDYTFLFVLHFPDVNQA